MSELIAYGNQINNIFQLIGKSEDDITKSIAWALCNCSSFLENNISELLGISIDPETVVIRFQESETDKGRTDLELTDNKQFYIIVEAKKGWVLPQSDQLSMYSQRDNFSPYKSRIYVFWGEYITTLVNFWTTNKDHFNRYVLA